MKKYRDRERESVGMYKRIQLLLADYTLDEVAVLVARHKQKEMKSGKRTRSRKS